MNALKTAALLGVLTVGLILAGDALLGPGGMWIGLAVAGVMNFIAYFFSDKIALRAYRAQPINPGELPRVERMMANLVARTGMPAPKLFLIPSDSPNAFATGRNPKHASIAVTRGIVELLTDEELEGVLAHELAHVRNRDILIATVAATLAGAITIIARLAFYARLFGGGRGQGSSPIGAVGAIAMLILAPIAAMVIQLAISRAREYAADARAAQFTDNPIGLARALRKLEMGSKRRPLEAGQATAHMFIVAPMIGGGFASLFSTHPPISSRIERLTGRPAEFLP
jgi:heat shock protein HtpX